MQPLFIRRFTHIFFPSSPFVYHSIRTLRSELDVSKRIVLYFSLSNVGTGVCVRMHRI